LGKGNLDGEILRIWIMAELDAIYLCEHLALLLKLDEKNEKEIGKRRSRGESIRGYSAN